MTSNYEKQLEEHIEELILNNNMMEEELVTLKASLDKPKWFLRANVKYENGHTEHISLCGEFVFSSEKDALSYLYKFWSFLSGTIPKNTKLNFFYLSPIIVMKSKYLKTKFEKLARYPCGRCFEMKKDIDNYIKDNKIK